MGILQDKVTIVTGCGKGIGRAIGLAFAEHGAVVVAVDVDTDSGEAAAEQFRQTSPRSIFRHLDIADPDAIKILIEAVAQGFGTIDVLVNNAGVTRQIDFFDLTPAELDWITSINIRGTFSMMQAAARVMREKSSGRIVNISSIAGKGYKNTSNIGYAASKGAIIAMTRVAAARLGKFGIRVNAVCPGLTSTELMDAWLEGRAADQGIRKEELAKSILAESALQRLNTPSDIAEAVVFLASDASRNITGQSINVDSGMLWD
jgi:NAD(P)-dependent dehydrogenase (short-subunit alcohol dehydrogenase family)